MLLGLGGTARSQSVSLSPYLYHTPVLLAEPGKGVEISLHTEDGASGLQSAALLWRLPGGEFRTGELEPSGADLFFTIPAEDVKPPYLEYAILITFADGRSISFPLVNPLTNPHVVAVASAELPKRSAPTFYVLYPREGEIVFASEVRIAVSIFTPDSLYDPATLTVLVDRKEAKLLESTAGFALAEISQLRPGKHEVILRSKNPGGESHPDLRWQFQTSTKAGQRPHTTFSWNFRGEGSYEDLAQDEIGILRGDFRVKGEFGKIRYSGRCFLTSEESWDRQPQNRFFFGLKADHFHLNMGDAYPSYADLVLSGKRVRGIELGYHARSVHVIGIFGEISKAIEGETYRRDLWAFRSYYSSSGGARIGLTLLKAKDDLASVNQASLSPMDNVVTGLDVAIPLFHRNVELSFAAAL
ncbi:MAG: hypothetical protein ABH878_07190, partial [bacterium]